MKKINNNTDLLNKDNVALVSRGGGQSIHSVQRMQRSTIST